MARKGKIIGGIIGIYLFYLGLSIYVTEIVGAGDPAVLIAESASNKVGLTLIVISPLYPLIGHLFDKKTEFEKSLQKEKQE